MMNLILTDEGIENVGTPRLSSEERQRLLAQNRNRHFAANGASGSGGETIGFQAQPTCAKCGDTKRLENSVLCRGCVSRRPDRRAQIDWQEIILFAAIALIFGTAVGVIGHILAN